MTGLIGSPDEAVSIAAIQLAGSWKLATAKAQLVEAAGKSSVKAEQRAAAFAALREIGGTEVIADLTKIAGSGSALDVRREAAVTLAALELPTALPHVIATLKATTNEAESQALWRALLGIRGVSAKLATELEKTELPREVARAGLRPAREGTQHQALVPVLLKNAGLSLANVQLTPAELQKLAAEALAKGDAARGEHIYRRAELACIACHAIGGAGGKIGPDLTSIGASAPPAVMRSA